MRAATAANAATAARPMAISVTSSDFTGDFIASVAARPWLAGGGV
jgi:hypothetical protein